MEFSFFFNPKFDFEGIVIHKVMNYREKRDFIKGVILIVILKYNSDYE